MAVSRVPGRWDIVVLPFPYSDRLAEKRRPALVVSSDELRGGFGLLWVAMITSAGNQPWTCDVDIADIAQTGLPAPSVVRPAKLATVEAHRVIRTLGRLPPASIARVQAFLARAIGQP